MKSVKNKKKSCSHRANSDNQSNGEVRESPQVLIEAMLSKTKMCKYMVQGMCMKGSTCKFAHYKQELNHVPNLANTKLCKAFMKNGHCDQPGCSYAHSKDELRPTQEFHKTKLCRFWPLGTCELGQKCQFAHSNIELRPEIKTEGVKIGHGSTAAPVHGMPSVLHGPNQPNGILVANAPQPTQPISKNQPQQRSHRRGGRQNCIPVTVPAKRPVPRGQALLGFGSNALNVDCHWGEQDVVGPTSPPLECNTPSTQDDNSYSTYQAESDPMFPGGHDEMIPSLWLSEHLPAQSMHNLSSPPRSVPDYDSNGIAVQTPESLWLSDHVPSPPPSLCGISSPLQSLPSAGHDYADSGIGIQTPEMLPQGNLGQQEMLWGLPNMLWLPDQPVVDQARGGDYDQRCENNLKQGKTGDVKDLDNENLEYNVKNTFINCQDENLAYTVKNTFINCGSNEMQVMRRVRSAGDLLGAGVMWGG